MGRRAAGGGAAPSMASQAPKRGHRAGGGCGATARADRRPADGRPAGVQDGHQAPASGVGDGMAGRRRATWQGGPDIERRNGQDQGLPAGARGWRLVERPVADGSEPAGAPPMAVRRQARRRGRRGVAAGPAGGDGRRGQMRAQLGPTGPWRGGAERRARRERERGLCHARLAGGGAAALFPMTTKTGRIEAGRARGEPGWPDEGGRAGAPRHGRDGSVARSTRPKHYWPARPLLIRHPTHWAG